MSESKIAIVIDSYSGHTGQYYRGGGGITHYQNLTVKYNSDRICVDVHYGKKSNATGTIKYDP